MNVFDISYDEIRTMSKRNKIEIAQALSKRANTRLKSLEKNGYDKDTWAYGKAQRYISAQGRTNNRFYEGSKNYGDIDNERVQGDLNRQIQEVLTFLNSTTSTKKGIDDMLQRRYETFSKNQNFEEKFNLSKPEPKDYKTKKDYNQAKKEYLMEVNKHYEQFYDFVKSKQLELMKKQGGDSSTYMEDFVRALQQGYSVNEIMEQYAEYTNTSITFDEVQEKYERAEWQLAKNGGQLFKHENIVAPQKTIAKRRNRQIAKAKAKAQVIKGSTKNANNTGRNNKRKKRK